MQALLSIKQILEKPSHERTSQEQKVAIALNMALNRTHLWKQSGKPRIDGVLADLLDRQGLPHESSEEESRAFNRGRECIRVLLEYYSLGKSKPIESKALVGIFKFSQKNLHPSLREGFGHIVNSIIKDENIQVSSRVELLLAKHQAKFIQRSVKEAVYGIQGKGLRKMKGKGLGRVTSLEFDAGVSPNASYEIGKKIFMRKKTFPPRR